jgi:hypothetical protein
MVSVAFRVADVAATPDAESVTITGTPARVLNDAAELVVVVLADVVRVIDRRTSYDVDEARPVSDMLVKLTGENPPDVPADPKFIQVLSTVLLYCS